MEITKDQALFLGLKPAHVKILSCTNNIGTINEISKLTKIPRTSLYHSLTYLKQRGLILKKKVNKKIFWHCLDLKSYSSLFHTILDRNSGMTSNTVKVSIGSAEMIGILYELTELPRLTRIYGIQPQESLLWAVKKVPNKDLTEINRAIKKRGIIVEGVVHENSVKVIKDLDLLSSMKDRSEDMAKISNMILLNTAAEIYCFPSKCIIFNWKDEFAVTIEDVNVYTLMKEMFLQAKEGLQKFSQNERLNNII